MYSSEYTEIPKVFFTPHHVGRSCINAKIQGRVVGQLLVPTVPVQLLLKTRQTDRHRTKRGTSLSKDHHEHDIEPLHAINLVKKPTCFGL